LGYGKSNKKPNAQMHGTKQKGRTRSEVKMIIDNMSENYFGVYTCWIDQQGPRKMTIDDASNILNKKQYKEFLNGKCRFNVKSDLFWEHAK
jgi:hypothetical protein